MSTALELRSLTYREARVLQGLIEGKSDRRALMDAGFSSHLAEHPGWLITPEIRALVEESREKLQRQAVAKGLVNAGDIHEYLTDAFYADMRDIRNDDGSFKPQSEWPEIWGRMMEAGDCEVETVSVRSHDGQDDINAAGESEHGWEETGKVVTKVKLKFSSRTRLLELAMKHKGVDAMVEQKAGNTNINITVTAQQQRLERARKRIEKVIDVTPEPQKAQE